MTERTIGKWYTIIAGLVALLLGCQVPAQAQGTSRDYRIDAGDILNFDILDDDELPVQVTVSSGGQVQLPILGAAAIAGMTISEVLDEIRKQFIQRQLLIDPKIAISVVTFRPIFVLGEVRNPGSFLFQPYLTTEQAIGLAGGPLTALNNAEDRVMTRARLQGDLYVNSADISRESSIAARYAAQMAGRTEIESEDVPAAARPFLDQGIFDKLSRGEERTLKAEAADSDADAILIGGGITEAERQVDLLQQLVANQKKSIKFSEDGLKRTSDLLKKGLKTAGELAEFQRQLTSDEGRLLDTLSEISQAKRNVGALKRELAQLASTRKREAHQLHQEHSAMIEKLIASRRGIEEQLLLVASMNIEDSQQIKTATISYNIRRRGRTGQKDITADSQTELHPGDVLIVAIESLGSSTDALTVKSPEPSSATTQ